MTGGTLAGYQPAVLRAGEPAGQPQRP